MTQATHVYRRIGSVAFALFVLLGAGRGVAAPPDVKTIIANMKQAMEPAPASLRKVRLTVAQEGATSSITLGEARAKGADGNRILAVVLAPADLRGTAYLTLEQPASNADKLWVYVPAIGRVREVVSPEAYSAVLNSDFTYADLGFVTNRSKYSLLGEETTNGVHVYKIQAVPPQTWYYARVVTTVAADSSLPIDRTYYDPANELWKVERFQGVSTIDGVPTALTTTMDDMQSKSRSTLEVTDLRYGAQVPDALMRPESLPQAVASPVWASLDAPVHK